MVEVVVATGAYKTGKAPVKSLPPTNNTQLFYNWMPFLSPNQQCQGTEAKTQQNIK